MLTQSPFRALAPSISSSRLLVRMLAMSALSLPLFAQTAAKPSAAQPVVPATLPTADAGAAPQQGSPRAPRRSHITFEHGLLTVTASNASLNGLIRDIARQTGMKVSGAVAEDRVFGTYGPADPQKVLATLLDGTGSNILILSNAADSPLQLILTPRTGAATPPNPNANLDQNDEDDDGTPPPGAPTAAGPRGRPAIIPGSIPNAPPAPNTGASAPANQIAPASQTLAFPPIDSTSAPATATTTPDAGTSPDSSADAVRTPQQIFEQLQRLRQQNTTTGVPAPQ